MLGEWSPRNWRVRELEAVIFTCSRAAGLKGTSLNYSPEDKGLLGCAAGCLDQMTLWRLCNFQKKVPEFACSPLPSSFLSNSVLCLLNCETVSRGLTSVITV